MWVRRATVADADNIRQVHEAAFSQDERDLVARLAVDLLQEQTIPPTISLVAAADDSASAQVIGHIAFSPVSINGDDLSEDWRGYVLAPLGVEPDHQNAGVGSKLVEHGMNLLREQGVDVLLVYGDPRYYGRFGFKADLGEKFVPPYDLEYPFGWLATTLNDSAIPQSASPITCVSSLSDPMLW